MVTTDRPIAALPIHKQLVEGKLDNGFTYVILPNSVPAGRFEAHLEVLSGSAHELEQQQGADLDTYHTHMFATLITSLQMRLLLKSTVYTL
jgi:predicted Zn-dependent peptidase